LLRHTNVKMDQVCQDKSGRLGGVAGSVVLYVIECPELRYYIASIVIKNKEPLTPNYLLPYILLKILDLLEANLICSLAI
jgi:hypothetical protein